jgi:hypothetical protein
MKIQKQLLESLIRVCAKEVLAQLNEGKKKSKKCKCGKQLLMGATECKDCMEEAGLTSEGKKNWIQKAIKKPGALHKQLNVPTDEKIPTSKLNAAGGKLGKRANLAKTLKGLHEEDGEDEIDTEEDENDICPTCNGSGEGMADGLRCSDCKGSGSTRRGKLSKRNDPDYDWDSEREDDEKNWGGIDEEDSNTVGAPQSGSGESVDIETERPEVDSEPSEKETPQKKEKLQGLVLLSPDGSTRNIPIRMFPSESDIEKTLHRIGANLAGNKVKVSLAALRTIKTNLKSGKPIYCYLGTLSDEAEELFVFANTNLNAAKEEMAPIEKIKGEDVGDATEKYNNDQTVNNDDELLAKRMAGEDKPNIDREIGYDDSETGQD